MRIVPICIHLYIRRLLQNQRLSLLSDRNLAAVRHHRNYILAQQALKDKMGEFSPEDLRWVVEGEMEYADSLDEEEE